MKNTGLFYAEKTVKTANIAKKIVDVFGQDPVTLVPIEGDSAIDFEAYDNLILGVATWFDGELPTYWDEVLPELDSAKLSGRKVAIFGLGDQVGYPDNFADGIGLLADAFEQAGAVIVGYTPTENYVFSRSKSLKEGLFRGLVIDVENQPEKTNDRIRNWVEQLRKEFL